MPKKCFACAKEIVKQPDWSNAQFEERKFCSDKCRIKTLKNQKIKRVCKVCGKSFEVPKGYKKRGFYCSQKCYGVSRKGKPSWNKGKHTGIIPRSAFKKGQMPWCFKGWRKTSQGYIALYSPKHPFKDCNNYVLRSRIVMEKHLKRFLKPEEIVHHINGIRNDDRLTNLLLFINQTEHKRFHSHLNNPRSKTKE